MAIYPTAAVDHLNGYNGDRYNPQTNALGFAIGGHRVNFVAALRDTASVAAYIAAASQETRDSAQVAADRAAEANAARDLAQRWASAPEGQEVAGGFNSAFHYARKSAASASAAATFDPAVYVRRNDPITLPASTADAAAPLTIPEGVEPTTKKNGNIWTTVNGIYARLNGVTRLGWDAGNAPDTTDALVDAGVDTNRTMFTVARVWRAARAALPLPTNAQIEAGTDTVARSITMAGLSRGARAAIVNSAEIISNANLATMAAGTVKMRSPGTGTGAPVDTTLAQLVTDLGFSQSIATNGWTRLPNGLVIQWGVLGSANADYVQTLPTTFPNAIYSVVLGCKNVDSSNTIGHVSAEQLTVSSITIRRRRIASGNINTALIEGWFFAIGS